MQTLPASTGSFLNYLKFEKRYSAHTVLAYSMDLHAFLDFIELTYGTPASVADISYSFIRSWMVQLKEDGQSARSINRKISVLKSFFKHQLKEGHLETSPMTRLISPKISKRLPVFVKEDEMLGLLETLNHATEDWKTLNAKMLVTLFYTIGMRLSELINMKDHQVDAARLQLRVLGKGNKERNIPVSTEVIAMIADYQRLKAKEFETKEPQLLVTEKGKKMYPKYAYLLVKQYLSQAATLDKKSPHVLRHSFATHLLNKGAELNAVKDLLGHSSLAATQVYTHNTIEKLKDVYRKAHPKG